MVASMSSVWTDRLRGSSTRPRSGRYRAATKGPRTASRDGDPSCGTPRTGQEAGRLRVLVANAPLSYREAMAVAITMLRPDVEVLLGEPEALDLEVERFCPDVVVCSHVTPLVEGRVPTWVDLYPDGDRTATIGVGGRREETAGVELDDLLFIIDQRVGYRGPRG